jgi:hypothetical protein
VSNKILLVQGDNLPRITVTLSDPDTGEHLDLSQATTIALKFRAKGSGSTPTTIPCTVESGGVSGAFSFAFPDPVLDVAPGEYEAEIEINFSGQTQTIYDPLRFKVREKF